jgi:hypothetical protein
MLTSGVVLLHVSVCPHRAAHTQALLEHFNWELFELRPYSPGFTLSDGGRCQNVAELTEQTCLTQAYKNLFLDTSASVPVVTTLRSSFNMYVFFVHNTFFLS